MLIRVTPVSEYLDCFTPSQRKAFEWITSRWDAGKQVCILLTGGAGVGKSYLLKALTSACLERKMVFKKTGTTGIAAYLIGGSTLHSFLRMNYDCESSIEKGDWDALALRNTNVIFIDEVSMLTREALAVLDVKCREFCDNQAPFAGKSIILLGDPAQLQPVGNHIWTPEQFSIFQVAVLRESKRQSDPEFIALLNRMRLGEISDDDWTALQGRVLKPGQLADLDLENGAILYPRRAGKDVYNLATLNNMPGELFTSFARDVDAVGNPVSQSTKLFMNNMFKKGLLPPETLHLKVGAKVMLLRNFNVRHGWVNGALCIVESCTPDYITVHLKRHPNRKQHLQKYKTECPFTLGPKPVRIQFPLDLGWASTVHKGQGQTIDPCVFDPTHQFASGMGYTACSRASAMSKLHLISLGDRSQYRLDESLKRLLEWMDVHDVCRGWDSKTKRAKMPLVPQTGGVKRLQMGKVQQQPKSVHVVPPPVLAKDDDFGFFQELDPLTSSLPEEDDSIIRRLLCRICDIPLTPLTARIDTDCFPSETEQRHEYIRQMREVRPLLLAKTS